MYDIIIVIMYGFKKTDIYFFVIIYAILSLISIFIIQYPDWDFLNYHYFNAYALLNDRIGQDFLVANFRSYINPYVDTILYLLIKLLNNHPYLFMSIASLDNTIFLFMVYKISSYLLNLPKKQNIICSILIILYTALSPIMLDGLNYSMNDVFVGNFVLIAFYLLIKNLFKEDSKKRNLYIAMSGLIIGAGVGLKLTVGIYCIVIFLAVLILNRKIPQYGKVLVIFTLTSVLSFLIVDGYWMYKIYKLYLNPLFPYYNNIFKSPYFDNVDIGGIEYSDIMARNIWQYIFYPFLYSENFIYGNYKLDWDPRYAINFISILVIMFILLKNKFNDKCFEIVDRENLYFLILFLVLSYYINGISSSVYRFIVSTSVLYGLTLLIAVFLIVKNIKKSLIIFTAIMCFAYINNTYHGVYHFNPIKQNAKLFYNNVDFGIQDNSYVVLLNLGISYIVEGQNKNANYMGFVLPSEIYSKYKKDLGEGSNIYFHSYYMFSKYLEDKLQNVMQNKNNKIYVMFFNYMFKRDIFELGLDKYSNNTRKIEKCRILKYNGIILPEYATVYMCEYNLK